MAFFRPATAGWLVLSLAPAGARALGPEERRDAPGSVPVLSEQVEVNHGPGAGPTEAAQELSGPRLEAAAAAADAVEDALASLPGASRSTEALALRGGRPSQSGARLGNVTLNDPATGEFRAPVPVETVASVEVLSAPAAAEFGRFSSGLLLMHPQQGGERWTLRARKVDPVFRFDGKNHLHLHGVRSFGPRLSVQGPLVPGRVYLAQTAQYRFSRGTPDSGLRGDEGRQEALSSVTRLDAQLGVRHRLEALFGLFPERRDDANRTTFVPAAASYDQRTSASALAVSHSVVLGAHAVLSSSLSATEHRLRLGPPQPGPWSLQPAGASGSYFNRQDQRADTLQAVESLAFAGGGAGAPVTVIGVDLQRVSFQAGSASGPVELRRGDATLARRVTFDGGTRPSLRTSDVALFGTTAWRPLPRLRLQLGLRLDRDGVTGARVLAPRAGAWWQDASGRFSAQASAGVFTERTPSIVGAFSGLEGRTETRFAEDGRTELGRVHYVDETAAALAPARGRTWSGTVWYRPWPRLQLQLGALGRQGRHEPVVAAMVSGSDGRLLLDSQGESRYREIETAVRYTPGKHSFVSLAWVHSRAEADFNAMGSLFGPALAPVVRDNVFARSGTDVPDRLLARAGGVFRRSWRMSAALDLHSGMPWSPVDADLDYLGSRNSRRLPTAALLDLAVEHGFRHGRWQPWVGLAVTNALKSQAAREVQTNVAAADYGVFYNAVPRRLRLLVSLSR